MVIFYVLSALYLNAKMHRRVVRPSILRTALKRMHDLLDVVEVMQRDIDRQRQHGRFTHRWVCATPRPLVIAQPFQQSDQHLPLLGITSIFFTEILGAIIVSADEF